MNIHLRTFAVAPLTAGGHPYPFRIPCRFEGRAGHVVADQIRTVNQERLIQELGRLAPATIGKTMSVLQEMFAP